jgi:hypothetical protein
MWSLSFIYEAVCQGNRVKGRQEARSSFLKKRTKKLLLLGSGGRGQTLCKGYKKILRSFFKSDRFLRLHRFLDKPQAPGLMPHSLKQGDPWR